MAVTLDTVALNALSLDPGRSGGPETYLRGLVPRDLLLAQDLPSGDHGGDAGHRPSGRPRGRRTHRGVGCRPDEACAVLGLDPARFVMAPHGAGRPEPGKPNARQLGLVYDLVVRGTFGYSDWGHRDRTPLRWFTRGDLVAAVRGAGWRVLSTSHPALRRSRSLDRLTRGRSTDPLVGQVYLLATRG